MHSAHGMREIFQTLRFLACQFGKESWEFALTPEKMPVRRQRFVCMVSGPPGCCLKVCRKVLCSSNNYLPSVLVPQDTSSCKTTVRDHDRR